jgi:hypothetical protein
MTSGEKIFFWKIELALSLGGGFWTCFTTIPKSDGLVATCVLFCGYVSEGGTVRGLEYLCKIQLWRLGAWRWIMLGTLMSNKLY